jgi:hypothetical protein
MPPPSSQEFRRLARGLFAALSRFAVLTFLAGCTMVPGPFTVARRAFSSEHFCPIDRIAAVEMDATPLAPPPIADDPERSVMWRRHFAPGHRGRHRVLVRGCEEGQMYSCWWFGAQVPNARHGGTHYETIGASCAAEEP